MAADTWPNTLPQGLLIDDHQMTLIGDGRIRSNTETGPGKQRLRSTAMSKPLAGHMYMNETQWRVTLYDFVKTTLGGGVLPFFFPDPVLGTPILVQFGDNLPSIIAVSGSLYDISIELEVLP